MNRQIILGIVVVAMGTVLRFPLNVIQVIAGLFLLTMGIIKYIIDKKPK